MKDPLSSMEELQGVAQLGECIFCSSSRKREQFPTKGILKHPCDRNTERIQPPKKGKKIESRKAQADIMRTFKVNKKK